MKFIIAKLEQKDIASIRAMGMKESAFSTENGNFWSEDQLSEWAKSETDLMLVAKSDGVPVGFAFFAVHFPTKKITIENLFVLPEYRGQGVASELMKQSLEILGLMKYLFIVGHVNAGDQGRFIKFLERYGFKKGPTVVWVDKFLG